MADNNSNCCEHGFCVGYAFVPRQTLGEVYDAENALNNGTLFPELNLTITEYGKVCKEVSSDV